MRTSAKMLLLMLLAAIFIDKPAEAQRIYPGSKYVNNVLFKSFSVTYKLSVVRNGNKQDAGELKDELRTVTVNRQRLIVRVQNLNNGESIDTSITNADTYEPVYHSGSNTSRALRLNFSRGRVTGSDVDKPKNNSKAVDVTMVRSYFDSSLYDLLVRGALIHDGYEEQLPVYLHEAGGLSWVDVTVPRAEKLQGMPDAWVVETTVGGTKSTMWIAKESRDLLRQITDLPGNAQLVMEQK